jgi:hypothetical protein
MPTAHPGVSGTRTLPISYSAYRRSWAWGDYTGSPAIDNTYRHMTYNKDILAASVCTRERERVGQDTYA